MARRGAVFARIEAAEMTRTLASPRTMARVGNATAGHAGRPLPLLAAPWLELPLPGASRAESLAGCSADRSLRRRRWLQPNAMRAPGCAAPGPRGVGCQLLGIGEATDRPARVETHARSEYRPRAARARLVHAADQPSGGIGSWVRLAPAARQSDRAQSAGTIARSSGSDSLDRLFAGVLTQRSCISGTPAPALLTSLSPIWFTSACASLRASPRPEGSPARRSGRPGCWAARRTAAIAAALISA